MQASADGRKGGRAPKTGGAAVVLSRAVRVRYFQIEQTTEPRKDSRADMPKEQTDVPDLFRRALALARENEGISLKELRRRLYDEFNGSPMPPLANLTIPEQDSRAPEEDWTAGLSLVRRGIQQEDWRDIIDGIALSLEQTLRYERERGPLGQSDEWHDRTAGIEGALQKGLGKWMPEELMRLAEQATKK